MRSTFLLNLQVIVRRTSYPSFRVGGRARMKSIATVWNGIAGDVIRFNDPYGACLLV